MKHFWSILMLAGALSGPAVQAQFSYTTTGGSISITGYTGTDPVVTIPSTIDHLPVTSIGIYAFYNTTITSISIPEGVTNIDAGAFTYCYSLATVALPASLTTIGAFAFENCDSLTTFTIPAGVTNLGNAPFDYCTGLQAILVASGNPAYHSAGGVLFNAAQTTLLEYPGGKAGSYAVPGTVTNIGDSAFYGSAVTSVSLPAGLTRLGYEVFANCFNLTSVTLPAGLVSIGDYAFSYCDNLKSISLPAGLTSLGHSVFNFDSSLTTIALPASLTSIGAGAFAFCSGLTAYTVDPANPVFTTVGGVLFDQPVNTLIAYPPSLSQNYTVPATVTNIGDSAFADASITGITLPNGLTTISAQAFEDCYGLTNVVVPASVTNLGDGAFEFCYGATNILFQGNAPTVGLDVFNDDNNTTLYYLPDTTGWTSPFADRPAVLVVPPFPYAFVTNNGSITITGYSGPGGNITIPATITGLPVTSIGDQAFYYITSLTGVTIPAGVTNIGYEAFYLDNALAQVQLPAGLLTLGDYAFNACSAMGSIRLPGSLVYFGSGVFSSCSGLTNVVFGNGLTSIGSYAFFNCQQLGSLTIPASVTIIGDGAFELCFSLTNLYFQGNAPAPGATVFGGNPGTAYYLPGTTGWGPSFDSFVTKLWNAAINTTDGNLGLAGNQFGFTLNGPASTPVLVEATTNLASGVWSPVRTVMLNPAGSAYFSEPVSPQVKTRYYRFRTP